jgi:hypothetical protein
MRRLSSLAVVAALFALASAAGAEDIHVKSTVGTWKLNLAKSKTEAWNPRSQTRVYEDWGGGLLHMHYEGTNAQGNPTLSLAVGRVDGKEYPFLIRGAQAAYTQTFTPVDDRTIAFDVRADGKTTETGTKTMAADGKSFAITFKTNNKGEPSSAVLVFDKQ